LTARIYCGILNPMLLFERLVSRRGFLKTCIAACATGALGHELLKVCQAQALDVQRGYYELKEAQHYAKLGKRKVKCQLCPRECVVGDGKRGFCRVRENRSGSYYTLAYANPCAVHIDPMEKKPLFHFLPGSAVLSLATAGCNFTCKNCQNWNISQARTDDTDNLKLAPEDIVKLALEYRTPAIAYTYTEPTVFFEYMLATAKSAREQGILNVYHSNGYIKKEPLDELCKYLDGANVDLKGFSDDFYRDITGGTLPPVLDTLKQLKENGVWLEITNLVIPAKNDSDEMLTGLCEWVVSELGADTPLHFSRFYPQYKLDNISPTPLETMSHTCDIARAAGLHYVYIGNVPGVPEVNTYCPKCRKLIIERAGYQVLSDHIRQGKCIYCKNDIAGRWQ